MPKELSVDTEGCVTPADADDHSTTTEPRRRFPLCSKAISAWRPKP
jgi:hypothetical protein